MSYPEPSYLPEPGDLVRYRPGPHDAETAARNGNLDPTGLLDPDATYEVTASRIDAWHTDVWIEGFAGSFNSVHFVKV